MPRETIEIPDDPGRPEANTVTVTGCIVTAIVMNLAITSTVEAMLYPDLTSTRLFLHLLKSFCWHFSK